jgi:hypothetical protein
MNVERALDQVTATLRGLSTVAWVLLVVGVIVVLALVIAGFLWWRRRRAAAGPAPAAAVAEQPAKPPVALGKQLVADARRFRRGLPGPARRCFEAFHPVVVLGTESSGKAMIIERFAGVAQRRVELGRAADLADGQLRCLIGGEAVVFDLSEEVVRAPRELVDAGLSRALAPVLRRRAPVVVVCLSPETLDKLTEQQLAELGSALRAKLDVLAALRDEPCAVRVVVSDVPGFARFDALFRLLQLPGIPAVLPIDGPDEATLRGTLLGYADELCTALTALTPRETLALVGFFEALPQLSGALSMVLGELFAPAGELTPRPDGLYLVPAQGGPNPLAVPEDLKRPGPSPLLKHRLIALSVALAAGTVLLAGYDRDAERWDRAAAAATSYELTSERELDLRLAIRAYTSGSSGGLGDRLTPGFFVEGPAVVACSFVEQVRQDHLVGSLASAIAVPPEQRRPEQALYAAALLYASQGDELGHLVGDRLDEWAGAVDLERSLVADYLHLARPYRDERWLERLREAVQASTAGGVETRLARFLGLLAPGRVWTQPELAEADALARRLRPELRELAQFGAAQRILVTPPLDRVAPTFKVHAPRFGALSQLWDNRVVLDRLLQTVIEGGGSGPELAPRSFAELTAALAPVIGAGGAAAEPSRLVVDGHEYAFDPTGFTRAVRGGQAERIITTFVTGLVERAPGDGARLLFPDAAQWKEVALPVQWPAGSAGAETHQRVFTREAFEHDVKPQIVATHQLLDRLADRPALHARLAQVLARALAAYATGYLQELERVFGSFGVTVSSEAGAQRVLRVLAGPRSPVRELVQAVAHDAELGLASDTTGMFEPMLEVEERFGALAELFAAGKTGDAFAAYQDVLRELAARLASAAPAGSPGAAASEEAPAAALAARLSPAGNLALALASGAPDTPLAAVQAWLDDNALTDDLADAFRMPVRAVYRLGARDIEAELAAWYRELAISVDADLFSRFPFDRRSGDDLDPQTLAAWLHPKHGRLAVELVPALTGLLERSRSWDGHPRHRSAHPCTSSSDVCVRVPAPLLVTLDRLAATAELLWDEAGKPRPLEVEVTPRPFTIAGFGGPVPELVRMTAGDASVLYFNQRPKRTVLALDWTRDQAASLSVQIKQDSFLSLTPPAVVVAGTPWSFFHLLEQAEHHGPTHTWRIRLGPTQMLAVSYDVKDGTIDGFGGGKTGASRGRTKAVVSRGLARGHR